MSLSGNEGWAIEKLKGKGDCSSIQVLTDRFVIAIQGSFPLWCKAVVGEEVCHENLSELWVDSALRD